MPDSKFDLGDYVEVKDRIKLFYELFGQGRLVTEEYQLTTEPDGKAKVIVKALAYRTPEDPYPGVGLSWMYLPGSTSYTKGSELENTETSAWGRAIGSLGILIDRSIASGNEIRAKAGEGERNLRVGAADHQPADEPATNGGLIGVAERTDKVTSDFHVRQTTEGPFIGFRLKDGIKRNGILVEALGPLAEDLYLLETAILGHRVQVWGHWVTHRIESANRDYDAFRIERITGPTFTLPETTGQGGSSDEAAGADPGSDAPAAPDLGNFDTELDALPLFQDNAA